LFCHAVAKSFSIRPRTISNYLHSVLKEISLNPLSHKSCISFMILCGSLRHDLE
jgi:hypothetical protein